MKPKENIEWKCSFDDLKLLPNGTIDVVICHASNHFPPECTTYNISWKIRLLPPPYYVLSNFIEKKLPFFRVRFTYFLYHHFPKKVLLYSNVRNVISRSSVRLRLPSPFFELWQSSSPSPFVLRFFLHSKQTTFICHLRDHDTGMRI